MPLNLSNLKIARDVDVPKVKRGRSEQENPLAEYVIESRDNGNKGMALTELPVSDVREAVNYLRYAGNKLGIGVRIFLETVADSDGEGGGRELTLARKTVEVDGTAVETGLDVVYKDAPNRNHDGLVNILFRTGKRKERKVGDASNGEDTQTEATDESDTPPTVTDTATDAESPEAEAETAPEETPAPRARRRR